jgi:DNA polymerase/3'-5' exonuclease PolX
VSEGKRIPRDVALEAAKKIYDLLAPVCQRIEVAGSLRRGKPDVGDIEMVCVPMPKTDLLGNEYLDTAEIVYTLARAGYTMPRFNGEHFKQFSVGPCNCDLFITTMPQWGVIYTIRTGSAEFSHRLVTTRQKGGLLPSHLKVKDGRVWNGDDALDTRTEEDLFIALGLKWISPKDRI